MYFDAYDDERFDTYDPSNYEDYELEDEDGGPIPLSIEDWRDLGELSVFQSCVARICTLRNEIEDMYSYILRKIDGKNSVGMKYLVASASSLREDVLKRIGEASDELEPDIEHRLELSERAARLYDREERETYIDSIREALGA